MSSPSDNEFDDDVTKLRIPISIPTPGRGIGRSASNSSEYDEEDLPKGDRSGSESPTTFQQSNIEDDDANRREKSDAAAAAAMSWRHSNRSGSVDSRGSHSSELRNNKRSNSRLRSPSPESVMSRGSKRSNSYNSKRSLSPNIDETASNQSRRSSVASNRSASIESKHSNSSRSRSPIDRKNAAERSRSARSERSISADSARSRSVDSRKGGGSRRSGSPVSHKSVSRGEKVGTIKSRSLSPNEDRGRGRRRRSGSEGSRMSDHSIPGRLQRQSRSRSKSQVSDKRSSSNSPNLQIDESIENKKESGDDEEKEESEVDEAKGRRNRMINSDSDEEENVIASGKEAVSAAAIFGDDADDISSEDDNREDNQQDNLQAEEHKSDEENDEKLTTAINDIEPEEENEAEPIPETRIDVEIPKISCDLGRDIHFVKLPNFLSVETRPFDPETYEDEIDEEETLDEEGRARLKLKVENTIRWKEAMDNEDGSFKKLSNARMVRWSDGSYSLHLGSEIFDVYKQPLQGDHNHLFIRQGTGLQGQAVFRTKLSFRPHSTESFTHRKMTLSLADRSTKTAGIKILSQVGVDPDHDRATLLKKEEEKLRQTAPRPTKPRKKDGGPVRAHTASSSTFREEDGSDDEGAISLNAIKNKYKQGSGGGGGAGGPSKGGVSIYSSDEEGSEIETNKSKKQDKAKVLKIQSESSEDSDE